MELVKCKGYRIRADLYYDGERNLWIEPLERRKVRIGFDPLGVEVNGTLAQLIIGEAPRRVRRGDAIGTIEADKFVGPLESPLSGSVADVNGSVISCLGAVYEDCYAAWLLELAGVEPEEFIHLIQPEKAAAEFEARVERYQKAGVLAW